MEVKDAKYEVTAVNPAQYPHHNLPEVALVGRSNVGKSSIINTLLNRKNLARISSSPGKTREINFFSTDRLYFVDLPGYGYAQVSKTEKALWEKMIETYLYNRKQLQLILMLVDIRHTPTAQDMMMYDWLIGYDKPRLVVATKLDKISRGQVRPRLQDIKATLGMDEELNVIPFSAETKQGRDEIWREIRQVIG